MTPSLVPLSSLPNGTVLVAGSYAPAAGATAYVYEHGTTTEVPVYETGTVGPTLAQPLKADTNGQLPGYVLAEQDLDIAVTFLGHSAGAAIVVPLRADDLVGEDPSTKALAIGAGGLPVTTSATGIPLAQKGAASGVATLDSEEHLTLSQVPVSVETASTAATKWDPIGDAGSAVSAHVAATDPHGDRAFATAAITTEAALLVPENAVGAASGVASLTSLSRLVEGQLPLDVLSGRTVFPVERYGVSVAKTGAENYAILKTLIETAEAVNGTLYVAGFYPINEELVIKSPINIFGTGVAPLYGPLKTLGIWGFPAISPFLVGSGFIQETANKNGVKITCEGAQVNFRDFGIKFADSIKFKETGHGVLWEPPLVEGQTYRTNGPYDTMFSNVMVYGHDGNHYAFDIVNGLLNNYTHLRGWGGGGLRLRTNGNPSNTYGNTAVVRPNFAVAVKGSAHGLAMEYTSAKLAFLDFYSYQALVYNVSLAGVEAPTSPQDLVYTNDRTNVFETNFYSPDFETNVASLMVLPYKNRLIAVNDIAIASYSQTFASKEVKLNEAGDTLKWRGVFTMTPTAGEAAVVQVYRAKEASMSGKILAGEISVPAGVALDGFKLPLYWEIAGGEYMEVILTNATRSESGAVRAGLLN